MYQLVILLGSREEVEGLVQSQVLEEECPKVLNKALRILERWEMASIVHLCPPLHVIEVLYPSSGRTKNLFRIHSDRCWLIHLKEKTRQPSLVIITIP